MGTKRPPKQEYLKEARDLNEVDGRVFKQEEKVHKAEEKLREEQEALNALYTERSSVNAAFLRAVRDRAE